MNIKVNFIVLTLFLFYVSSIQAASIGRSGTKLRCQCIKTSSNFIHPRFMENIEIIPSGPHCGNVEIIATLQDTNRVCLDPESSWVNKIIKKILSRPKTDAVQ
ncbi:interleukin-8-like [Pristis pectinata]|uniref:interleukin-8-like n=1 Tax=Pristis pectinata TaxID=685728 RepID=UPI00223DC5D0|nr:interleukin-8-like [Pristis pectinata]